MGRRDVAVWRLGVRSDRVPSKRDPLGKRDRTSQRHRATRSDGRSQASVRNWYSVSATHITGHQPATQANVARWVRYPSGTASRGRSDSLVCVCRGFYIRPAARDVLLGATCGVGPPIDPPSVTRSTP
jgi:hypothetical protein